MKKPVKVEVARSEATVKASREVLVGVRAFVTLLAPEETMLSREHCEAAYQMLSSVPWKLESHGCNLLTILDGITADVIRDERDISDLAKGALLALINALNDRVPADVALS